MSRFIDNFLSEQQCSFRKGYNIQHCLFNLLEKWGNTVDKGKSFGALLTDLSKAFGCLDYELLTAKLITYGFNLPVLRLIHDYLSNKRQRTKIDDSCSSRSEILFGVPRWSILGSLLFGISLVDLSFIVKYIDIASYSDDSMFFINQDDVESLLASLEGASFYLLCSKAIA